MGEHLSQQMQGTLERYGAEFSLELNLNFYLGTISRESFSKLSIFEDHSVYKWKGTKILMRINEKIIPIIQHSGIMSPL